MRIGPLGIYELLILLSIAVIPTALFWHTFRKAGLPSILSLLTFIPPFGLVPLLILAFAEWPRSRGA